MPNWCSARYVFYTNNEDKSELLRLHKKLSDIIQTPSEVENDFGSGWLGKVAIKHGFDWEKISCRGWINDLGEHSTGENSFTLDVETAWSPVNDLWEAVIAQYEGVSYVYTAEEPGIGVFINTDIDGTYLNERYLLEIYGDAQIPEGWYAGQDKPRCMDVREYFEEHDDLLDYCLKLTGNKFNGVEELQDYLSNIFDKEDNTLAIVHEFTTA